MHKIGRDPSGASGFATRFPLFSLPLAGGQLKTGGVHVLRLRKGIQPYRVPLSQ